jgi:hypothetical protein
MAGVIPHAVGLGGKWLDPTLDEGADKLEARYLFLRCSPKLLDLFHQRLRDLHLLVGQLMHPQRPGPKDASGAKFLKPEFWTGGGLVLGIEPLCPPAGIVFRRSKAEVFNVLAHLAAEATGLVMERAPDDENSSP